jgi:hypothetical protein
MHTASLQRILKNVVTMYITYPMPPPAATNSAAAASVMPPMSPPSSGNRFLCMLAPRYLRPNAPAQWNADIRSCAVVCRRPRKDEDAVSQHVPHMAGLASLRC